MYPTQGGYQPPNLPSFGNAAQRSIPPAKKPKGNPIITRYPPPPGYQGSVKPQAPYQQSSWPQAAQFGHGHGSVGYPGLIQQSYGAMQAYPQPSWPDQSTTPPQQFTPGYSHNLAHPFYAPPTQSYPAVGQTHQSTPSYSQSAFAQTTFPVPSVAAQRTNRQNSTSLSGGQTLSNDFLDGNGDPLPPPDLTVITGNELEHEFDSECYFARHPDEIHPDLSLGQILWCAPQPTRRALPGVFAEAELEAIAPRHPFPADEESVSEYFVQSKREETLLNVRQTDLWHDVKYDMIYKEFPALTNDTIPRPILIKTYRNRPDPSWSHRDDMQISSPTSDPSRSSTPAMKGEQGNEQHDSVIEVDYNCDHDSVRRSALKDEEDDVLGGLEHAIYSTESHQPPDYHSSKEMGHSRTHTRGQSRSCSRRHSRSHSRSYSRASSVSSAGGQKITRPVPLPPLHDQNQEEILASLGVTGEARLVYQTPGPAFGPPPSHSILSHSRHGSATSSNAAFQLSKAQQHVEPSTYDPWSSKQSDHGQPVHHRASSVHSQQTTAGSDFQPEDIDVTPRPTASRMDSRKRGYEDDDSDANGAFEPTPKPKKGRTQLRAGNIAS